MYKKKTPANLSTAVTSAALQDHLLRKANFNLDFLNKKQPNRRKTTPKTLPSLQKTDNEMKRLQRQQKKSILPYENQNLKKLREAVQEQEKIFSYNKKLTLAQKLGLVEAPPPPLSNNEWQAIEQKSRNRNDSDNVCSICLQNFKIEPQVILSCSHVFHGKCLQSYEKHNKVRCCPICRRRDYEKKVIDEAIRMFTLKCIVRIQRVFRGSQDRIRIYGMLTDKCYQAKSKLFNRRLIGFKMWKLSKKISDKVKHSQIKWESLLNRMQKEHKQNTDDILDEMVEVQRRKLQSEEDIQKYLAILGIKTKNKQQKDKVDWQKVQAKGVQRVEDQCPICLMALWTKPVYLLSCTHLFHVNCIEGLERYALPGNKSQCPCCRSKYQKKLIQTHPHNSCKH